LAKSKPQLPNVTDYLDFRVFLQDWFEAKKRFNSRYSHRVFVRMAGKKSPSLLKEVIEGKRKLSSGAMGGFVKALGLNGAEESYFSDLVALEQEKDVGLREKAWLRLSAKRRFSDATRLEGVSYAYLAHWYCPAIRELASSEKFRADPKWIAKQLRPPIPAALAKQALKTIVDLGLVKINEDGSAEVLEGSLVTPHEVAHMAAGAYHRQMLSLAVESVGRFGPEERHLQGVTVCVSPELIPKLKMELDAFQERILDLCDSAEGDPTQAFQLSLSLFPLSGTL
jgi:uncharacterized protein (TIGR02147 family)